MAVVVADSPYTAADGMDAVNVEYEVLPALADGAQAMEPDAAPIHEGYSNRVAHLRHTVRDVDSAIDGADPAREAARSRLQSFAPCVRSGLAGVSEQASSLGTFAQALCKRCASVTQITFGLRTGCRLLTGLERSLCIAYSLHRHRLGDAYGVTNRRCPNGSGTR